MQEASSRASAVIDFRLYRLAFVPTLVAVVVVMFSLQGAPDPVEPATPPATFEGDRATALARQIVAVAPDRAPGSPGDDAIADLVRERFGAVAAGAVTEQAFEAEHEGEQVSLRNVVLTLPGDAESSIVIAAARDSASGPGAASSAAATAVLVELANALGVAEHDKTLVLASISGAAAGQAGARELLETLPEADTVDAVIVISQPGASSRRPPFVVTSSTEQTSGPVQLERTAELAVSAQAQESSGEPGAVAQLARLAIPAGLGAQAPLVGAGIDAVAISASGERPLTGSEDELDSLSGESLDAFGRAAQSTVNAVDVTGEPLVRGPDAYLEFSDNLVPGWTLALLSLTLILPAAVAAVDGCARASRQRLELTGGLAWAAAQALPVIGALALLYGLAFVGAIPRPPFPFDPSLFELATRAAVVFSVLAIGALASTWLLVRSGLGPRGAPPAGIYGLGAVAVISLAALWLANPFLALLLCPAAHVWLLAAALTGPLRALAVGIASALACAPAIVAVVSVAEQLALGADAPWTLTLMVADGQVGLGVTLPVALLAGALGGTIGLCLRDLRSSRLSPRGGPPVRTPGEPPTDRTSVELDVSPISSRPARADLGLEKNSAVWTSEPLGRYIADD